MCRIARTYRPIVTLGSVFALAGTARAHGGGLADPTPGAFVVPTWLFLTTGGGVVLFSFLLTTVVTDRETIESIHAIRASLTYPSALRRLGNLLGIGGLVFVVVVGFLGPADAVQNAGLLLVWVGWWAGLAMVAYLLGNPWPALDPWRRIAGWVPGETVDLPARLGRWPRVAALLIVVWVELVSPLASNPRILAWAVVGYSVVTIAGMARYGDNWVDRVDPIAGVFRTYGLLAPVQRTDSGLSLRVPGSRLTDRTGVHGSDYEGVAGQHVDAAFVIALLWGTTFDGLSSTPLWVEWTRPLVAAGVPAQGLYLVALVGGFALSYGGFRLVVRASRLTGPTFLASDVLASRFARGLVPIAAGYHLAHYLGYFLGFLPTLVATTLSPLLVSTAPPVLSLPAGFGYLALGFVLLGHVLAVWVAHSVAYHSFPGHIQAVQSQYPLTLLMIAYTMLSLWIVSRPSVAIPYL